MYIKYRKQIHFNINKKAAQLEITVHLSSTASLFFSMNANILQNITLLFTTSCLYK